MWAYMWAWGVLIWWELGALYADVLGVRSSDMGTYGL